MGLGKCLLHAVEILVKLYVSVELSLCGGFVLRGVFGVNVLLSWLSCVLFVFISMFKFEFLYL